jgi:hypothetical protein
VIRQLEPGNGDLELGHQLEHRARLLSTLNQLA